MADGVAARAMFSTGYGPVKRWPAAWMPIGFRRGFITFHDGFPAEPDICKPRDDWLTVGVRH